MSEPIPNPLVAINNAREDSRWELETRFRRQLCLDTISARVAARNQQQETTINNLRQELLATRRELLQESFKVARLTALLRENAGRISALNTHSCRYPPPTVQSLHSPCMAALCSVAHWRGCGATGAQPVV